jgi:hypothetical protein
MNAQLAHTFADRLNIAGIAVHQPTNPCRYPGTRLLVA